MWCACEDAGGDCAARGRESDDWLLPMAAEARSHRQTGKSNANNTRTAKQRGQEKGRDEETF